MLARAVPVAGRGVDRAPAAVAGAAGWAAAIASARRSAASAPAAETSRVAAKPQRAADPHADADALGSLGRDVVDVAVADRERARERAWTWRASA